MQYHGTSSKAHPCHVRPPVLDPSPLLPPTPRSALKMWVETLEERDRVEAHYQTNIFDMKSTLEERIKRADDIGKAYKHFRLEVAKSAEHSKTGRPISERLLAQLEQEGERLCMVAGKSRVLMYAVAATHGLVARWWY